MFDKCHCSTTLSTLYLNGLTLNGSESPYYVSQDVIVYDFLTIERNVTIIFDDTHTLSVRGIVNACNRNDNNNLNLAFDAKNINIEIILNGNNKNVLNLRDNYSSEFCNILFVSPTIAIHAANSKHTKISVESSGDSSNTNNDKITIRNCQFVNVTQPTSSSKIQLHNNLFDTCSWWYSSGIFTSNNMFKYCTFNSIIGNPLHIEKSVFDNCMIHYVRDSSFHKCLFKNSSLNDIRHSTKTKLLTFDECQLNHTTINGCVDCHIKNTMIDGIQKDLQCATSLQGHVTNATFINCNVGVKQIAEDLEIYQSNFINNNIAIKMGDNHSACSGVYKMNHNNFVYNKINVVSYSRVDQPYFTNNYWGTSIKSNIAATVRDIIYGYGTGLVTWIPYVNHSIGTIKFNIDANDANQAIDAIESTHTAVNDTLDNVSTEMMSIVNINTSTYNTNGTEQLFDGIAINISTSMHMSINMSTDNLNDTTNVASSSTSPNSISTTNIAIVQGTLMHTVMEENNNEKRSDDDHNKINNVFMVAFIIVATVIYIIFCAVFVCDKMCKKTQNVRKIEQMSNVSVDKVKHKVNYKRKINYAKVNANDVDNYNDNDSSNSNDEMDQSCENEDDNLNQM